MRKIKIICPKNQTVQWIQEAIALYEKKLKNFCCLEIISPKECLFDKILEKTVNFIALDLQGDVHTSSSFAQFFIPKQNTTFVIGPSNGLTQKQKLRASHRISLSKMTFTHQQTKILLLEQLYRSIQIEKKTPYHK